MKEQRNLSGVYFRQQNKETGKWENVCFEDLEKETQEEILNSRIESGHYEFVKGLVMHMANTINDIARETGIAKE